MIVPDAFLFGVAALVAASAAISVRIVRTFAVKRALLDIPNDRSSHKLPVPRLGGAAFMPIVLIGIATIWGVLGDVTALQISFLGGAILLFGVSLIDDFVSLSTSVRFAVQFLAASAVVVALGVAGGAETGSFLWAAPIFVIGAVGLLNIYNFMDGIDGIAGIQAVVGGLFWFCAADSLGAPAASALGLLVAAGAIGFLLLNWPPAKIFMGDAGSTVLGYAFAVLPLLVCVERPAISLPLSALAGALVVWPFLADGTFTILRRLRKRENIFKAHRSHLYQRLVIAGRSHRNVTLVYGALAGAGAFLGQWVISGAVAALFGSATSVGLLFAGLWAWTVQSERHAARGSAGPAG